MNRYKLDYSTPIVPKIIPEQRKRRWSTTIIVSICFFCFVLLLFGGIGTSFQNHGNHKSLREQHDELQLRYDSLFAAKLQVEKQLSKVQYELQLITKTSEK